MLPTVISKIKRAETHTHTHTQVFRVSGWCPPQTVKHSQPTHSFTVIIDLWGGPGNKSQGQWMGCPTFNPPGPRKDSALCPDVISKSLLLRLSTPLPSHPGSHRWAAIGRAPPRRPPPLLAPVPKSLRGASVIDLTLVWCCFPFPAPTFNSVYCFYVSPAYYCVPWQEHNKR